MLLSFVAIATTVVALLRWTQAFTFADGTRTVPNGPFDSDDAQSLIEAVVKGVGITQFMRIAIEDELTAGRLNVVLPEIPTFTTPIYVLHAFEKISLKTPLRDIDLAKKRYRDLIVERRRL